MSGRPLEEPDGELAGDQDWQRLDPRMLLVHPLREVGRFVIPLLAFFVAGSATENPWQFLGVLIPVAVGLARYLTTRFRVAHERVELRSGLLSRHVLSTPLDRVRSVDLTASPAQRVLGLTRVRIGTGVAASGQDDRLDLDGLPTHRARALRAELLRVAPVLEGAAPALAVAPAVRFDPSWLRFAPFTSAGLVLTAAVLGVGSQLLSALDLGDDVLQPTRWPLAGPPWTAVALAIVVLAVATAVLSVVGYLLGNGNFRLSHADGSWHVHRGLLTTRETSLDDERIAGVSIGEPLGLRAVHGARLNAIATGLQATQQGSSSLVPPAPRAVVDRAAAAVCGAETPVLAPLCGHGPAATRRRFTRALTPAVVQLGGAVALVAGTSAPWWLVLAAGTVTAAAAGLALDRSRGLGHRLVDGFVVVRSGSLLRRRDVLAVDHVIGWGFRATWWQRRAGLTSLLATTAGGGGAVTALDVPETEAVRLADAAVPGLARQFLA